METSCTEVLSEGAERKRWRASVPACHPISTRCFIAPILEMSNKPCDQCTRRKVRCNYEKPCNRCVDTDLTCTHSIVRKKRGPRKGKGAILNSLRAKKTPVSPHNQAFEQPHDTGNVFEESISRGDASANLPVTQEPPMPLNLVHEPFGDPNIPLGSFLSFDEFTQQVLADGGFLSYDQISNAQTSQDILGETTQLPAVTPLGSGGYETPGTAFATTVAFPDGSNEFEVTSIVERSLDLFFIHIHPIYPLLSKDTVLGWLRNPHLLSKSEQTLIWSICATTLAIVDSWPTLGFEQRGVSARRFIRRCQQLRLEWDYVEEVCFDDVLTSLFIGNAYFDLKCRKASWMYVREAITLAIAAGLHDDTANAAFQDDHELIRKRTYALLYITERGASIFDGFPVSVLVPPTLPAKGLPGEDPSVARGLSALHGMFSLLDFKFVKLWNPGNASFADSSFTDLLFLQTHLRELQIDQAGLSDVQRADLLITQQWLRLIFWQASLRAGFISSTETRDPSFTYHYPIEIATELCAVVKSLPPMAVQANGLGIFEKQFEIAYSLMDALTLSGTTHPEHHECLRYLLLSLSASPNSRQIYVRTLEQKMGGQQKYRSLAGVELLREGSSRQNSRRQSKAFAGESRRQEG